MSSHPVESLSALLDGELPDAERRAVEAHLDACPSCARHLRELTAVDALARGLPPAAAPDGYLETLPGRVRRRIRADRPAAARAPWVWPLAAGLALAVLAPIVLRERPAPEDRSADRPAVEMELPMSSAPAAPEAREAPAAGAETAPRAPLSSPAPFRARRREAARAAKTESAFAPPPPAAAQASEGDRGALVARSGARADAVGGIAAGPRPAAAPPAEAETMAVEERVDTASSLKRADSPRQNAAEPKQATDPETAFQDNASLPASTIEEARRAREAWRRFVAQHPSGPRADEGRVRHVEAAVAVFRLTGDEGDRAIAEREGRAYLAVPGAPQASRVRDALRVVER